MFNTDMSGLKLPLGLAIKSAKLRSNKGFPDIIIYEPRGGYFGLFLELKSKTPYKKDGKLRSDGHLGNQEKVMLMLKERGFLCFFMWDFDCARATIDNYLKQERTPTEL